MLAAVFGVKLFFNSRNPLITFVRFLEELRKNEPTLTNTRNFLAIKIFWGGGLNLIKVNILDVNYGNINKNEHKKISLK